MKVSIIIPTYNRAGKIGKTIKSALNQDYPNCEVIVVDDGSTDETLSELKSFGNSIVVISQRNAGPSAARNKGFNACSGDLIAFLDSDDIWLTNKISQQARLLDKHSNSPCCLCNAEVYLTHSPETIIDYTYRASRIRHPPPNALLENPQDLVSARFVLFNQTAMIRREAFELVGGFDESLRLLEDYKLTLQLSTLGPWLSISDPLVKKYDDDDGLGSQGRKDRAKELQTVIDIIQSHLNSSLKISSSAKTIYTRTLQRLQLEIRSTKDNTNLTKALILHYRILQKLLTPKLKWRPV